MQGYLDAVDPGQSTTIVLAGIGRRVSRARLGLHLQLARLAGRFDDKPDPDLVRRYLEACGLTDTGPAGGVELLAAYVALRRLNEWQWELPFMNDAPDPKRKSPPYEYQDRYWAWLICKLANRYGWEPDTIYDLWPEEAMCYLQECIVMDFDEIEERRSLSELAYRYDKHTGKSKFIPLSRPNWMAGIKTPKKIRIRRDRLPMGYIVDLETLKDITH